MTMNPLMSRFNNQPTFVAGEMRGQFESCLHQANIILTRIDADMSAPLMTDDFWFDASDWRSAYRPYIVKNGILMIPVKGVLLHDFGYQFGSWATGYTYIWKAFERGLADGNVRGIALICDSPGGQVAGNFELVDRMYAARGEKPIRAYAAESAYSAAYSIASVADPGGVNITRTGGVGSIGVLTVHVDVSKAMDSDGVKVTFIFAGKHKVDGNPYEPLPDDVKARIQERIDELYAVFVSTVARNRAMDEKAIRATEALTFTATQAVSNGLADSIGSLDDAIAVFSADLSNEDEDEDMAIVPDKVAADQAAAIDTARSEGATQGRNEGLETGRKEGATAERARIVAILGSDEGKKRPKAAMSAALRTDMTVEQASAFLGDLAVEQAETTQSGQSDFAAAMDKEKHPETGAPAASEPTRADRAMAAAGFKSKKAA